MLSVLTSSMIEGKGGLPSSHTQLLHCSIDILNETADLFPSDPDSSTTYHGSPPADCDSQPTYPGSRCIDNQREHMCPAAELYVGFMKEWRFNSSRI